MVWQKAQGVRVAMLTPMHENWRKKIADTSSCKANAISQSFSSCVVPWRASLCTLPLCGCVVKAERPGGYQPLSISEGRSTTHNVSLVNFIGWRTLSHFSLDHLIYHPSCPINLYPLIKQRKERDTSKNRQGRALFTGVLFLALLY